VEALDGAPGVYSARFAGPDKSDLKNNKKLLEMLKDVPWESREAQFRCVVSILGPDLEEFTEGIVRGTIGTDMRGSAGFGYDPLFIPEGYDQTFAELGSELKNRMSHRALAFEAARKVIEKYIL
jgi:XTP/dITP diphosphohydrolase